MGSELNEKIGLILEGGGMRGAYTGGVLEAFMEKNIKFPYVIGVSAGANNGANFVAEQKKRSKEIFTKYSVHKNFAGFKHWLKRDSYFNMDFLYDDLPNNLLPFDYDTFKDQDTIFKVCATNATSGQAEYFKKSDYSNEDFMTKVLKASSSLPVISKPVSINGELYFDGGVTDSIPLEKSLEDGNIYNVIVLTRNSDYRKKEQLLGVYSRNYLKEYPKTLDALEKRHVRYNITLEKIKKLEEEGFVFVFRPIEEVKVGRLEKDPERLEELYNQGYYETMDQMEKFERWIQEIRNRSMNLNTVLKN